MTPELVTLQIGKKFERKIDADTMCRSIRTPQNGAYVKRVKDGFAVVATLNVVTRNPHLSGLEQSGKYAEFDDA